MKPPVNSLPVSGATTITDRVGDIKRTEPTARRWRNGHGTKTPSRRPLVPDHDRLGGLFKAMLKIRGDRSSPRIIYLDGRMTLVSPGFSHEVIKKRLGTLIQEVAFGLGYPRSSLPVRRRSGDAAKGGVEGDESYYFANADAGSSGKKRSTCGSIRRRTWPSRPSSLTR